MTLDTYALSLFDRYVDAYFPKAVPVVDSFHVVKLINGKLNAYLNGLRKKFKARDMQLLAAKQALTERKLLLQESRELYLLRKKKWLILSNQSSINYNAEPFRDWKFGNKWMCVSDYECALFKLDPDLEHLRNLKEKYITFNFEDISDTLREYREAIINSFIMVERLNKNGCIFSSRLSNGSMESLNRIPKDMKRHARGYTSFEHIRNRFLFAARKDAPMLAIMEDEMQIHLEAVQTARKRISQLFEDIENMAEYICYLETLLKIHEIDYCKHDF